MESINIKIGGEAGFGIMSSGLLLVKTFSRGGLSAITINDYPSLIRGGHNVILVRVADHPIFATDNHVDVLIALNRETIDLHKDELSENAAVIFDNESFAVSTSDFPRPIQLFGVPLMKLAKETGNDVLMRNTISLGAVIKLLSFDPAILKSVISDQFGKKGESVVENNWKAVQAGYDFVKTTYPLGYGKKITPVTTQDKPFVATQDKQIVITGNEALGLGAIAAGMKFFAAYPMTPINGLLFYLAGIAERAGFVYKQPEDEIAGINMAIGASFAGVRSMVATSGGGFSLMTEGLSFAAMIEQPLVIIYGQRPGPATGLPTWTTQGDLHFVLNASQGEFPRLVLAPGDIEEAYQLTATAFNISDIAQTPAFVLVDKYLCESYFTTSYNAIKNAPISINRGKLMTKEEQEQTDEISRYLLTEDGISPRPLPGRSKGIFRANSDEHNELGYSIEDGPTTKKMIEKRMKKMETIQKMTPSPQLFGDKNAKHTLVGWGSTKGIGQEVIRQLTEQGRGDFVNYLHLSWINPFPSEAVSYILNHAHHVIDIEGNHNAQMVDWIHTKTGFKIKDTILKYDGRPFFPSEVIAELEKYK